MFNLQFSHVNQILAEGNYSALLKVSQFCKQVFYQKKGISKQVVTLTLFQSLTLLGQRTDALKLFAGLRLGGLCHWNVAIFCPGTLQVAIGRLVVGQTAQPTVEQFLKKTKPQSKSNQSLFLAYLSGTSVPHVVPKQIRELQIFIRGDTIFRLAQFLQSIAHSEKNLGQVGRRRHLGRVGKLH